MARRIAGRAAAALAFALAGGAAFGAVEPEPSLVLSPAPPPAVAPDAADALQEGSLAAALLRYDEESGVWTATGDVTIRYRQYVLRGDAGEYDEATETATLRGNVTLDTGENLMRGGKDAVLTFHFPDRTWAFTRATTELNLTGLLAPVHISAGALSGRRQQITLRDVRLTTCPPEKPQYELSAREVTLVPDRRIVARRATASLFGRRLWTLPTVTLPIRREEADRQPIVPEVGQSTEEGAYIKASIPYAAGAGQAGAIRADLMQKQGLGLGVRHPYALGGATGQVGIYSAGRLGRLAGENFSANLAHRQNVLGFDTNVRSELRRNSYLYLPGTTSRNTVLSMARASGASDTQISFRYDSTRGSGQPYHNMAAALAQTYRYAPRGTVRLNLDDSRQSSASYRTHDLTTAVDVSQGFGPLDANLAVNHISVFGGGNQFLYRPVQRLPELTLRSDARRLGLWRGKSAPLTVQVSSGHFKANQHTSDRQMLRVDAPVRTVRLGGTTVAAGGGFRQAVYASDAAQFSVNATARVTQPLGKQSDFVLSYAVQAPKGYTPFQFDRPFAYDTLAGTLKLADIPGLEMRVGTGYDFRNNVTPWRDLLGYIRLEPSPGLRLTTSVAVNVNGKDPGQKSSIRYVNNALRLRLGRFEFDGESRFLPSTGRFGRLLGNVSAPIGRRWSVKALAGTTSGQRYRRLLVVRDMGCLEAYVAVVDDRGWRTERGARFMLRIKAFPMAEPFSTGMFGESLDIGAADMAYGGVADAPLSPVW